MSDTPFFAPPVSFGPSAAKTLQQPATLSAEFQELKRQYDELREQVKKLEARVDAIQFSSHTKLGSVKATGSIDP